VAKSGRNPEIVPVQNQEQQNQCTQNSHAAAIPFATSVSVGNLIGNSSLTSVGRFQHQTLNDVHENEHKQPDLQYTWDDIVPHEMGSSVKNLSMVICPDAGIESSVYQQKKN